MKMHMPGFHASRPSRLDIRYAIASAILASVALTGSASARPARCDVQIEGFQSYRGSCDFQGRDGGSFQLTTPHALLLRPNAGTLYVEQDGALVKLITPSIALLFGIGGAHQTGTYLAILHRQGACWVSRPPKDEINGNARVCAR